MDDLFSHNKRGNYSNMYTENYARERLESIHRKLETFQRNGTPRLFSISIDGELIIPKTGDLSRFFEYEEFIDDYSVYMELKLFFGASPNGNVYRFQFKAPRQTANIPTALSGVTTDDRVEIALNSQRLETNIFMLQRDKEQLETQIISLRKKLKKYKRLEEQLSENKIDINDLFSKAVQLMGMINSKGKTSPVQSQVQGIEEESVEIIPQKQNTKSEEHFEKLKEELTDGELEKVMKTSEVLAQFPELREQFQEIINQKLSSND
jgi:hypothetical protein